jgi:PKD repeat protein
VDETSTEATALTIQGEASDNAGPFLTTTRNVSARLRTGAAVAWAPGAWTTVGTAGPDQRTPDLRAVVQEIVGRAGWASGHALVLVLTGTGRRVADSYNGDPGGAPLLHVEYTQGPPANQAPNGTIDTPAGDVTIPPGGSVSFTGTGSDPDGNTPLTFLWNFGGGAADSPAEDPGAVTFSTAGTYTVTFTVTDSLGAADPTPDSRVVTVTPFNQEPTAVLSITPASGPAPLAVTADASGSSDPDGTIVSYRFDFGDGTVVGPQAGATASHTYAAGTWTATVTVTDNAGATSVASAVVTVSGNQPPNGVIDTPAGNVTILAGQSVDFAGTGSDPDGNLPLTYLWNFSGGAPSQPVEDPGAVVFSTPGSYTVTFTVTDSLGLADPTPASRVVTVTTANLLTNGGFEDGQAGWTNWSSSTSRFVTTLSPYAGAFALQIDAGSSNHYVYQTVPATAGVTYTVSFALRTALTTSVGRGRLEWLNSSGSKIASLYFGDTTGTTPWTVQSTTQTAPTGATQLRVFCYVTSGGSGSAWFDEVGVR